VIIHVDLLELIGLSLLVLFALVFGVLIAADALVNAYLWWSRRRRHR
jgi:hypothetical protein